MKKEIELKKEMQRAKEEHQTQLKQQREKMELQIKEARERAAQKKIQDQHIEEARKQ